MRPRIRSTTILCVRKDGRVVMGGDGQVTVGDTVMKSRAIKVRRLGGGAVLAGFAGAAAGVPGRAAAGSLMAPPPTPPRSRTGS